MAVRMAAGHTARCYMNLYTSRLTRQLPHACDPSTGEEEGSGGKRIKRSMSVMQWV